MRFAVSLLLLLASSHCCCALRVDPVGRRAILDASNNSAELNAAIEQYKNAPSFSQRWSTAIDNAKKDSAK